MGSPRAPKTVVRKARAAAVEVQAAVQRRVAARVDGFLQVLDVDVDVAPREPAAPERKQAREPVREKVERRLKQLHPMD
jgi:hypothetical protein